MSAKITGRVWDLVLTPAKQIVLLALADHADHNGGNISPGAPLIAWKTGYSERQVRRIMKDLEADGLLVRIQERKKKSIIYQIDVSKGVQKPPYAPKDKSVNHDKMSPSNHDKMTGLDHDKMSHDKMSGSQNQGKNGTLQTTFNPDIASAKTARKTYKDKDSVPDEKITAFKPRNEWYDNIFTVWGFTAGRNGDIEKMLRGNATKGEYKTYNLPQPLSAPSELLGWRDWYLNVKHRGRKDAILVSRLEMIQSSIGEWQVWKAKGNSAKPTVLDGLKLITADPDKGVA